MIFKIKIWEFFIKFNHDINVLISKWSIIQQLRHDKNVFNYNKKYLSTTKTILHQRIKTLKCLLKSEHIFSPKVHNEYKTRPIIRLNLIKQMSNLFACLVTICYFSNKHTLDLLPSNASSYPWKHLLFVLNYGQKKKKRKIHRPK